MGSGELAMKPLDRRELEFLVRRRVGPCVSILMPTRRAGPEIREDPIRLKNLMKEAESKLREMGIRSSVAREILSPIRQLTDRNAFCGYRETGWLFSLERIVFEFRLRWKNFSPLANDSRLVPFCRCFSPAEHIMSWRSAANESAFS
jgi:hypothetical protein